MIDSLFTAALTVCLLVGGTIAIGSAWNDSGKPAARAEQAPRQQAVASAAKPSTWVAAGADASRPALR